jgi:hypothetical protein
MKVRDDIYEKFFKLLIITSHFTFLTFHFSLFP